MQSESDDSRKIIKESRIVSYNSKSNRHQREDDIPSSRGTNREVKLNFINGKHQARNKKVKEGPINPDSFNKRFSHRDSLIQHIRCNMHQSQNIDEPIRHVPKILAKLHIRNSKEDLLERMVTKPKVRDQINEFLNQMVARLKKEEDEEVKLIASKMIKTKTSKATWTNTFSVYKNPTVSDYYSHGETPKFYDMSLPKPKFQNDISRSRSFKEYYRKTKELLDVKYQLPTNSSNTLSTRKKRCRFADESESDFADWISLSETQKSTSSVKSILKNGHKRDVYTAPRMTKSSQPNQVKQKQEMQKKQKMKGMPREIQMETIVYEVKTRSNKKSRKNLNHMHQDKSIENKLIFRSPMPISTSRGKAFRLPPIKVDDISSSSKRDMLLPAMPKMSVFRSLSPSLLPKRYIVPPSPPKIEVFRSPTYVSIPKKETRLRAKTKKRKLDVCPSISCISMAQKDAPRQEPSKPSLCIKISTSTPIIKTQQLQFEASPQTDFSRILSKNRIFDIRPTALIQTCSSFSESSLVDCGSNKLHLKNDLIQNIKPFSKTTFQVSKLKTISTQVEPQKQQQLKNPNSSIVELFIPNEKINNITKTIDSNIFKRSIIRQQDLSKLNIADKNDALWVDEVLNDSLSGLILPRDLSQDPSFCLCTQNCTAGACKTITNRFKEYKSETDAQLIIKFQNICKQMKYTGDVIKLKNGNSSSSSTSKTNRVQRFFGATTNYLLSPFKVLMYAFLYCNGKIFKMLKIKK